MKEEALKLADLMIDVTDSETSDFHKAGQMIRKLVEELDCWKLTAQHHEFMSRHLGMIVKERQEMMKPLSDDNASQIYEKFFGSKPLSEKDNLLLLIKAIIKHVEERHGIK